MLIRPADYSKIKKMSIVQLSRWAESFYQSAWKDGYDASAKQICDKHGAVQIVTADWIEENCGSDVLSKIMEGVENELDEDGTVIEEVQK